MLRSQGFKQMVSKPTHDSGTIIDHLYMSETLNTMQQMSHTAITVIMIAFYV